MWFAVRSSFASNKKEENEYKKFFRKKIWLEKKQTNSDKKPKSEKYSTRTQKNSQKKLG